MSATKTENDWNKLNCPKQYDQNWLHREMLFDSQRVLAYKYALTNLVTSNSIVMDYGAGSGMLSMLAAVHGNAKKVYAVELGPAAELARELVKANKLESQVDVIQADASTVSLPDKVDVIVSEWMGGLAVDENFVPGLIKARDVHLKPDGIMIPARAVGYASVAYDDQLYKIMKCWEDNDYGIDLSLIKDKHCQDVLNGRNNVKSEHIFSIPTRLFDLNMKTIQAEDANFDSGLVEVKVLHSGTVNCIAAWFECDMGDNKTVLRNDTLSADTHWGRTVFPIESPIQVEKGEILYFRLTSKDEGLMKCVQTWSLGKDTSSDLKIYSGTQNCVHSPGFH